MALFYVSYDLKLKDYPKLWARLTEYKAQRVLLSMWALKGDYTSGGLREDLMRFIDEDDRILVVKSSGSSWHKPLFDPNKM